MSDSEVKPVRYVAFGACHFGSQLPRIEQGLAELGAVQAVEGSREVDLIYANDEPRWQEAIEYRDRVAPTAKLVLCVLDLPEWNLPSFEPYALLPRLRRADAVVAISAFVQSQLVRYFGMPSTNVGQPIKGVTPDKRIGGQRPYPYRVLMAGRLHDPGKRADLAIKSLVLAGLSEDEVAVVGGQYPGWGTNLGEVSDEVLADLYASVDFVMATSLAGGLELPPLEAVAAGAVPILCSDLAVAHGTYPLHWLCYPHPHAIAYRLRSLIDNPQWLAEDKATALKLGEQVRAIYSPRAVAERILGVYQSLIQPTS